MTTNPKHFDREVIGSSRTNTTAGSQHTQTVDAKYLWSYAQEEALLALSEQAADGTHRLISDPERRAKRIAARYADLYFKSAEKSQGEVQFYWPALAAFVVKDIVEAYRFAREDVLQRNWGFDGSVLRNSTAGDLGSLAQTGASPYQHVVRTYAALAKGNLWLFMDIYPWLWYFLEYGLNRDGSLNTARLNAHVGDRDWNTFQTQSKRAVEALPYGPNWLGRLTGRISADPVYAEASKFFSAPPVWAGWGGDSMGYGAHTAAAYSAHRYVKQHVVSYDNGYRVPPSKYWNKFSEAYYVMESERIELRRMAADSSSTAKLVRLRDFRVTPEVRSTYATLIREASLKGRDNKFSQQKAELQFIAKQEQINVLQPLIYEDAKLAETMAMNHQYSRMTGGWLSPQFKVVFSASAKTTDSKLEAVFDAPDGIGSYFGARKVFTNKDDRMVFVGEIAKKFNELMAEQRPYMDGELRKIQAWLYA